MTNLQIIGGVIFIFVCVPLAISEIIPSKEERKIIKQQKIQEREKRKQEIIALAKEIKLEKEFEQKMIKEQRNREKEAEYKKYYDLRKELEQMPIYQRWRHEVMNRCADICQICGINTNLEVHHRISFYKILKHYSISTKERAFECRALWDIDNGEVLCKECHDKMESSKRQAVMSGLHI